MRVEGLGVSGLGFRVSGFGGEARAFGLLGFGEGPLETSILWAHGHRKFLPY